MGLGESGESQEVIFALGEALFPFSVFAAHVETNTSSHDINTIGLATAGIKCLVLM